LEENTRTRLMDNKYIRVTILATLFSQMGIWIRNFSVILFIMESTNNDSVAVSWIYVAEYFPIFIFSIIGGAFADRWRPKRTLIICDYLSAFSVISVLLALLAGVWQAIFVTTLVSAILSQFSQPSGMKLMKLHVPQELIQSAMALYQTLISIFLILGPVIGTFVYQQLGIYVSIGIVGTAFLMSGLILLMLPSDSQVRAQGRHHLWKELKEGFSYVYQSPILRYLGVAYILGGLAVGTVQPLMIFVIVEKLSANTEDLQWFSLVSGGAMIIGGVIVIWAAKRMIPQKVLAIGNIANAFINAAMGFSTNFKVTIGLQFLSGLILPFIQVGINTIVMKSTNISFVGRVNGVFIPIYTGSLLGMTAMSGWLKQYMSIESLFVLSGAFFVMSTLVIVRMFRFGFDSASGSIASNAKGL